MLFESGPKLLTCHPFCKSAATRQAARAAWQHKRMLLMQCSNWLSHWEAHLKPGRHTVHHDNLLSPLEMAAMGSQNADCSSHHIA